MGDQSEHSLLSASAAPRWTRCYGSVALESTQPNEGSVYADEGTAAHALSALLLGGNPVEFRNTLWQPSLGAAGFIGQTITVGSGRSFEVDTDFAAHVQAYVDQVRAYEGDTGMLFVETKVNYANWLGVDESLAWGTSDAIIVHLDPETITIDDGGYPTNVELETFHTGRLIATIDDLKFGAGVAVSPKDNEQAKLYAGGALNEIEMVIEVRPTDILRVVIHQPRIGEGAPYEWYITVASLKQWLKVEAAMAAQHAVNLYDLLRNGGVAVPTSELKPGDKQCRFCNAKAICPALTQHVVDTVANGFVDLDATTVPKAIAKMPATDQLSNVELAEKPRAADLIEAWLKAIRAEAERKLFAGEQVPGFKVVDGKKGSRSWASDAVDKVGKILARHLGSGGAYKPKELVSPTEAEKRLKAFFATKQDFERCWTNIEKKGFITQSEGSPTVAREDDKRPAIQVGAVLEEFTNLEGDGDDLSHLA